MCRRRILLKPIIEVSEAEKKNENSPRSKRSKKVMGKDIAEYID